MQKKTEFCLCGTGSLKTEHMLQFGLLCEVLIQRIWHDQKAMVKNLYSYLEDLQSIMHCRDQVVHFRIETENKKEIEDPLYT